MRISDWSSDVCSSDLCVERLPPRRRRSTHSSVVGSSRQGSPGARITGWPSDKLGRRSKKFGRVRVWVYARRNCSSSVKPRSEEHTSELQSLMRISYAVFCLKKKKKNKYETTKIRRTITRINRQIQ